MRPVARSSPLRAHQPGQPDHGTEGSDQPDTAAELAKIEFGQTVTTVTTTGASTTPGLAAKHARQAPVEVAPQLIEVGRPVGGALRPLVA